MNLNMCETLLDIGFKVIVDRIVDRISGPNRGTNRGPNFGPNFGESLLVLTHFDRKLSVLHMLNTYITRFLHPSPQFTFLQKLVFIGINFLNDFEQLLNLLFFRHFVNIRSHLAVQNTTVHVIEHLILTIGV